MIGRRLDSYRVEAKLGEGGMGEVYRATDTRLNRAVAVKVLPADVAGDPEREARFEREARAVAKLNHPNILALFDIGHDDGVRYLVTELVEGEPARGPLAARKLVDVGAQIADGLAAAHAAGVVHRDLKPDNILVTRDGRVKILDFGLARDVSPDGVDGGVTQTATSPGTVIGTVAYMSPEQARGLHTDARSDQFSLGLVLYELATGRRAFARDSSVQTLSAIIEAEADLAPLAHLPAPVRWVIERCLAKDPADRYASTVDLARDLRQLRDRQSELTRSGTGTSVEPPPARRGRWKAVAAVATVGAAAAALGFWAGRRTDSSVGDVRFTPFALDPGVQSMPSWSPDGQTLAYSGEVDGYYQIFTRQVGRSMTQQLTDFPADSLFPAWDSTGTRVYFQRAEARDARRLGLTYGGGEVWVVSAAGGAPERVTGVMLAFTLSPDGDAIVYVDRETDASVGTFALWSQPIGGGAPRRLITIPGQWTRSVPSSGGLRFSPDGRWLGMSALFDDGVLLFDRPLGPDPAAPRAARFLSPAGSPMDFGGFTWLPDSRRIAAGSRDQGSSDQALWLADTGSGRVSRLTTSMQWESVPAVSPDGSRLAFSTTPLDWDIQHVDLTSGASRPLVSSARYDGWGDWMPDGSGIIYSTVRTGRFEIWHENLRDRTTRAIVTPDAFPDGPSFFLVQGVVSPDGRSVAYVRFGLNERRIYVSSMTGSRPVRLTSEDEAGREDGPAWSPDGRWILFARDGRLMKALASGGTAGVVLAADAAQQGEGARAEWVSNDEVVYRTSDGLKITGAEGGASRLVTGEQVLLWDASPAGRTVYAVLERERRAIELVTVDIASGEIRTVMPLGRRPLSPDFLGYEDTLRAMRIAPDGASLMYAFLHPQADIWILEGLGK